MRLLDICHHFSPSQEPKVSKHLDNFPWVPMMTFTCLQHGRNNDEYDGDRDKISMITGTQTVANIIDFRKDFNLAVSGT